MTTALEPTVIELAKDLRFDVGVAGPADEPPVVLLHGFPQGAACWERVATGLVRDGHHVVVPDQRGYSAGARPEDVAGYAIEHLAADVLGIVAALGHERFHLVGHDWGAAVGWYAAAHHPESLLSLTAVSVPHLAAYGWALREDDDQREHASYIGLFRQQVKAEEVLLADDARRLRAVYGSTVPEQLVETYVSRLRQPGALTAALNWYRAMAADLGSLPVVAVPTTFVWGEEDDALRVAGAERCAEFVSADYRFVPLPGVGHWVPEQAPEQLLAAIRQRLAAPALDQ